MHRLFLLLLVACSSPKPTLNHHDPGRTRAEPAWAAGCIPKKQDAAPCIEITSADVSAIRDQILARLREGKDIPDAGMMLRLAEPPIAQWSGTRYKFLATTPLGHPGDVVELTASEEDSNVQQGFKCVLVRTDGAWSVLELGPFAAM